MFNNKLNHSVFIDKNIQYCSICKKYHDFNDSFYINEKFWYDQEEFDIGKNHEIGISPFEKAKKIVEQYNKYVEKKIKELQKLFDDELHADGNKEYHITTIQLSLKKLDLKKIIGER